MIGLDTNVVVRHLVQDDPVQGKAAAAAFARLTPANPGLLTTIVLVETYWVLTRAYGFDPSRVIRTLQDLADCAEIVVQDETLVRTAWQLVTEQSADFADALISACCRARGCAAVLSFDREAQRALHFQEP